MQLYRFLVIFLVALFTLCSCTPQQNSSDTKKTYTREEFKQKFTGLSGAFVIQELGNPDSTSEAGDTEYWYYRQVSVDQITGKLDNSVQLVFDPQSKQVSNINF
jgi:outer membrane protein assembly factor BamE (lipoprotein component of BamABCDE complex)